MLRLSYSLKEGMKSGGYLTLSVPTHLVICFSTEYTVYTVCHTNGVGHARSISDQLVQINWKHYKDLNVNGLSVSNLNVSQ